MTMQFAHAIWHAITQCLVATNNAEDEGILFCPWTPRESERHTRRSFY